MTEPSYSPDNDMPRLEYARLLIEIERRRVQPLSEYEKKIDERKTAGLPLRRKFDRLFKKTAQLYGLNGSKRSDKDRINRELMGEDEA